MLFTQGTWTSSPPWWRAKCHQTTLGGMELLGLGINDGSWVKQTSEYLVSKILVTIRIVAGKSPTKHTKVYGTGVSVCLWSNLPPFNCPKIVGKYLTPCMLVYQSVGFFSHNLQRFCTWVLLSAKISSNSLLLDLGGPILLKSYPSEANIAPANAWLEDLFPLGMPSWQERTASCRGCIPQNQGMVSKGVWGAASCGGGWRRATENRFHSKITHWPQIYPLEPYPLEV